MIMDIDKYEEAALNAQKISFAFEDEYHDKERRKMFYTFFTRYLYRVDPDGDLAPYDAMVLLWRTYPDEFAHMFKEMTDEGLITD